MRAALPSGEDSGSTPAIGNVVADSVAVIPELAVFFARSDAAAAVIFGNDLVQSLICSLQILSLCVV